MGFDKKAERSYEQLVKRAPQKNDVLLEILVWLGATAGTVAVFYIMIILARPVADNTPEAVATIDMTANYTVFLLVGIFLFMQAALFSKKQKLEYEYTLDDEEIAIDRVMPKGGRRSLVRASMGKIIAFGKYGKAVKKKYSKYNNKPYNIYRAYTNPGAELWYFVYMDNSRKKMAVIEPDEQMLEMIKSVLPSDLRKAAFELQV